MQKSEIDHILTRLLDSYDNVSDINLTVGKPFQVESSGELIYVDVGYGMSTLTSFQTETFALAMVDNDRRLIESLLTSGSCDMSYALPGKARFRVNIFQQSGNYSIVLRRLESTIPTIDSMNLPEIFYEIAKEKNGIVFFTGATGTGKTTSLAAILDDINMNKSVHVITLEDPVEYQHPHKKATFNQREMGQDFDTFSNGLRAALRQAPKVILVGEMRDKESIEIGLRAAETGHLVFTTLHTVDAGSTINRIIGMFDVDEEQQIRIRLAETFKWACCQRLLPKIGGGRIAAFEIMGANLRVKDAILNGEGEGRTFYEMIQQGKPFGMTTFDDYIVTLFAEGLITEETARTYASRKGIVGRGIDGVKSARGEATTEIERLEMDRKIEKV